jgi:hypothetical protein
MITRSSCTVPVISSNMEHQLDATITVLLISKINSTCFGQIFAHLHERKTEIFTTYGIIYIKNQRDATWQYVY